MTVPLYRLKPATVFLCGDGVMGVLAGIVERIPPAAGYATVTVAGEGRKHDFDDAGGDHHEFESSGFRRREWAAGTLVTPLKEGKMDEIASALVEEAGVPLEDIKAKVSKLQGRAADIAANKGKVKMPKKKKVKDPKAAKVKKGPRPRDNDCRCQCGTKTGGTFAPGHDARYFGWLKKISSNDMDFKELPAALRREFGDVKGVRAALKKSGH